MSGKKLSIALVQMAVSQSKEANLKKASELISCAAQNGAELICLPECFNIPYGIQYFRDNAESIPGLTSEMLSKCAKNNKIYLVGGSFPEICEDKIYNTCLAFGPDGELLTKFRKIHLFDIDIPGKITFKESIALTPGNKLSTFKLSNVMVGLGICYDIRFPLLANLYAEKGCHLLIYPGAFNMTTGPAHWELLARGRAIDNQLYIATISPARDNAASYTAWGHSTLVNPWGEVVVKADEKEQTIYGKIDLDYLEEVRQQIPIKLQQRKDIYSLTNCKETAVKEN